MPSDLKIYEEFLGNMAEFKMFTYLVITTLKKCADLPMCSILFPYK